MNTIISPSFPSEVTPIVRDMRTTARELMILDLLFQARTAALAGRVGLAFDAIEEALLRLGATNAELLARTFTHSEKPAYRPAGRVTGPDPRD